MRKDMDRILVGRPRRGGNSPKGTGRGKDSRNMEDLPAKESMKHRWRKGDLKELNENLAPFYRFLDKQVGRPWNDVYSEIREQINANSAVQLHILQHLEQHVELHVEIDEEGKPRAHSGWRRSYEIEGLYVCPKSGLLKENKLPSWKKRRAHPAPNYIVIEGKTYVESEHGWFEIELVPAPRIFVRNPGWTLGSGRSYNTVSSEPHWDSLHKKRMTVSELNAFYGRDVRCVTKRSLNKKELKKLGLSKSYKP
jgi:hypothetical protein